MPIAQSIIPGVEAQPTILPIGSRIEPQAMVQGLESKEMGEI